MTGKNATRFKQTSSPTILDLADKNKSYPPVVHVKSWPRTLLKVGFTKVFDCHGCVVRDFNLALVNKLFELFVWSPHYVGVVSCWCERAFRCWGILWVVLLWEIWWGMGSMDAFQSMFCYAQGSLSCHGGRVFSRAWWPWQHSCHNTFVHQHHCDCHKKFEFSSH